MVPLPRIRLFDHVGLGLIMPMASGVLYSNQVGGHACQQPEVQGVFVPLCNDLALSPAQLLGPEPELRAHFEGVAHGGSGATAGIDAASAEAITAILVRHHLADLLALDLQRLRESREAWLHMQVLAEDARAAGAVFAGFGPYPRAGILTWSNSD